MVGRIRLEDKHVSPLRDWPHVDGVQDLVVVGALSTPDVGQLPLQVILQVLHTVESDFKLERALVGSRVVENNNVVDLHFRHLSLELFNGFSLIWK